LAVTLEELKQRWAHYLLKTDDAVSRHPDEYHHLKSLICRINAETVDIGEYHRLACRIARLMETMEEGCRDTLFDYFCNTIDPRKKGCAVDFRFVCADLQNLLTELDHFRKSRRRLRLVK
jgi:hypothetical protein